MATMKVVFLGCSRRFGKSGKTGQQYDICELHHAWPLQGKRTDAYTFEVVGHEERKLELDPAAMAQFEKVKLAQSIEVELGPNPGNPMRNICTGLVKA